MNNLVYKTLVVGELTMVAERICSVILQHPEGRKLPDWSPGSHLDVELPNWITRQYSLCGDPAEQGSYRIAVRFEELSRGASEYVHRFLQSGTQLRVGVPRSTFPDRTPPETLFIAGGIGITAVISMFLRDHASGLRPTLLYAGRSRSGMPFLDELPRDNSVVLAPKDEGQKLNFEDWAQRLPAGTEIAACGPTRMVEAVENTFSSEKFTVHTERFRAESKEYVNTQFVAECARSGVSVPVPPHESLLDALAKSQMPVAGGCREGVCGSCELTVLAGEPEHRDLLGAGENVIYPCVSRSLTERLVLDI